MVVVVVVIALLGRAKNSIYLLWVLKSCGDRQVMEDGVVVIACIFPIIEGRRIRLMDHQSNCCHLLVFTISLSNSAD